MKFKVGSDSCEQIFMVGPQLTIEVITGANFMSYYDVILDTVEKCLKMKQEEVIRRHECFYNTVPETGNEIKLIAKLDQLTQRVHKIIVRNRQVSKSNVFFQCANKIKLNSAGEQVASVYSAIKERNAIKCLRNSVDMGSYRDVISDEMGGADMHIVSDMNELNGESENGFGGNEDRFERGIGVCE